MKLRSLEYPIMATSGVFQLLINEGVEDRFLTASHLIWRTIRERMQVPDKKITLEDMCAADPATLPTLADIQKTHVLFCNYSYRPFVSIGTQYNKKSKSVDFGQEVRFTLDKLGFFIADMVVHIRLSKFRAKDPRDRVSYTAFPGHKLLRRVRFQVNQVDLDDYDTEDYNNYYQHELRADDRVGWQRCVGQETPFRSKLIADPLFDMHQEERRFFNGPQTPKHEQDALDLWIPLLFWFRDFKQALPSYIVNWGITDVILNLAPLEELISFADYGGGGAFVPPAIEKCELYTNNVFVNQEVFYLFSQSMSVLLGRRHRALNELLTAPTGEIKLANTMKGPIEYMYFQFRPRSNANLYQHWYKNARLIPRYYKVPVVAKDPELSVRGVVGSAAPAVYSNDSIVTGATVTLSGAGLSSSNGYYNNYYFVLHSGRGHDPSNTMNNRYTVQQYDGATKTLTLNGDWQLGEPPKAGDAFELFTQVLSLQTATFYEERPTVDTLQLVLYGNEVIEATEEARFNYYDTYRTKNMATPDDRGSYVFAFALEPYQLQPSGHLNLSVSKETYLKYSSSWISETNRVDLIVRASALTFIYLDKETGLIRLVYA